MRESSCTVRLEVRRWSDRKPPPRCELGPDAVVAAASALLGCRKGLKNRCDQFLKVAEVGIDLLGALAPEAATGFAGGESEDHRAQEAFDSRYLIAGYAGVLKGAAHGIACSEPGGGVGGDPQQQREDTGMPSRHCTNCPTDDC